MGAEETSWSNMALAPTLAAPLNSPSQREEHWKHFDDSVNAVSFGFVATAILISMFLLMAIFERFLQQRSSGRARIDLEEQNNGFGEKLQHPSPKVTIDGGGILVLMPGEEMPTYFAHPAPAPCLPEPISWPLNHTSLSG